MNERFEKLVAKAFFDETADASDTKIYKLNDAQMQKFAELIVRECAAQAEEESSWPYSSFGKKIKEHFGITDAPIQEKRMYQNDDEV